MLNAWRQKLARLIAPRTARRAYASAANTRLTGGFGSSANTSADTEIGASLTQLRARSRQLLRDAPYARRAVQIVQNNIIGTGVGMQSTVANSRGALNTRLNTAIETAWRTWSRADQCHTGGAIHFADLERMVIGEVFAAGELFVRKHWRKFGTSQIPLALELIEAERLADEFIVPPTGNPQNYRLGIESDQFGRPLYYWIRNTHPGDIRVNSASTTWERVPAADIYHLRIVERWPQTRAVPWLHTAIRKLNDMQEYSTAELIAARMSANFFATIETEGGDPSLHSETQADGSRQMAIEPGIIEQLNNGEKLNFHAPNRPNVNLDPFMRAMLREVASGIGVSYEAISRDYSQSNYSSSRLSLLDDRDLWRVLQQWYVRSFREPLLRDWMQAAALARAIPGLSLEQYANDPAAFEAAQWKLRGWSWIDPTREVAAAAQAVKSGFTTVSAVIAASGGGTDLEDVIAERARELELFEAAGITLETTVPETPEPAEPAEPQAAEPDAGDDPKQDPEADAEPETDNGKKPMAKNLRAIGGRA
jgi:lambda family phage portal protein